MKNDDAERSAADNTHMRALTVPRYGGPDVLIVTQMPRPIPGAGETLVRVAWGAINAADWRLMRADPWMVRLAFGLRRPRFRALGIALSGTVVESAEVWAVTRANQAPMVAGLGAAQILDRESEDPISHTARSNVRFDSIVDTSGERNIFDYASILAPTGTYILVGGPMTRLAQAAIVGSMRSHRNGKTWKTFTATANAADLSFMVVRRGPCL
jgi:NADPH:quinone reductase-like Zn-dependent oxidoreductase